MRAMTVMVIMITTIITTMTMIMIISELVSCPHPLEIRLSVA